MYILYYKIEALFLCKVNISKIIYPSLLQFSLKDWSSHDKDLNSIAENNNNVQNNLTTL